MQDSVRLYLIIETSIRIVLDAFFLVLYLKRIYQLDRMASNNFHEKPKLMKFKIVLLGILELIFIAHIALAFTTPSYWVYPYKDFALVSIADFLNCFLQIYIIRKEHKKKALKSIKVGMLWILWLTLDISTIIFAQIMIPSMTILVIIFQAMALVALIVIGCVLEQKSDRQQQIINTTPRSPLMMDESNVSRPFDESISSTQDYSKLYIEFNKEFNVSMRNDQAYYEFKLAVLMGDESIILTRKQQDFINLVSEMARTFPNCEELLLKDKKNNSFTNIKKYGQEKQKVYQTYLVRLTQNQKYYTNYLMDFLDISPANRVRLTKKRENYHYQKKDSLQNQDEQKHKRPFFTVQVVNNKIHISNPQILQIILNKPRLQIQRFHNKLIAEKKLKMQLLSEIPQITELVHFILRVVNSKQLWRSFCEWMVLGKDLEEKIYNMFDFWNYGFRFVQVSIIGYEIAFDREGSIHNLYLLSLSQRKRSGDNEQSASHCVLKEDVTLKKRFNDFVKLDKSIKKFINTNNIKAPVISLPPKFSPFGTTTSPKSRQIYLDIYLNEVIRVEGISILFIYQDHCVKFLEFLEVDLGRFRDQFQKVDQDNLAEDDISSMVIDELDQRY